MNRIRKINTLVFEMAKYAINLSSSEVETKINEMQSDHDNKKLSIVLQMALLNANSQKMKKEAVMTSHFKEKLSQIHQETFINIPQIFTLIDTLLPIMETITDTNFEDDIFFHGIEIEDGNNEYSLILNESQLLFYITTNNRKICFKFFRGIVGQFPINILGAYVQRDLESDSLENYDIYKEDVIEFIKKLNIYINKVEINSETITFKMLKSFILAYYVRYSLTAEWVYGISELNSVYERDSFTVKLMGMVEDSDKFYKY